MRKPISIDLARRSIFNCFYSRFWWWQRAKSLTFIAFSIPLQPPRRKKNANEL